MSMRTTIFAAAFSLLILMPLASAHRQAVQTQTHDTLDGIEVDLVSVEVQNNVVTAKFRFRNTGTEKQVARFFYGHSYIMDETNQKKYFPLKDSDGLYIAGPQFDKNEGGRFWYEMDKGKTKGFWIKFPQPTDNPATITISVPEVPPFGNIKLAK